MEKIRVIDPDSGNIFFEIFEGPVKMAVIKTAVEMGIAEILVKESSPKKIGEIIGIESGTENLCYFLDSLTALGFCNKKNGEYFNNNNSLKYLIKESPTYMGGLVFNMEAMQHRNLDKIEYLIKKGPIKVEKAQRLESEEKWKTAVAHLASYQRAGMASFTADIISSVSNFENASKILDLGCGPGIMCMEILKRKEDLKGVLFDLPEIIEIAKKEAEKEGLFSRFEFIGGDYNKDDFGKEYDIIWASHNLYYVKEPVKFFKRIHSSLNKGGVFLALHEGYEKERTSPGNIVLSRLSLALEGQDVSFEKGEIAENLSMAGFLNISSSMVIVPSGEVELVTAVKES